MLRPEILTFIEFSHNIDLQIAWNEQTMILSKSDNILSEKQSIFGINFIIQPL